MQQARGLRLLPPVLLAFCLLGFLFFPQSCTSIDCPVNNSVETRYTLKKATGKTDTLVYDTLWLRTTRTDGTDTTLINGIYGVSNLTVPISHTQPEDVLYTDLVDTTGTHRRDTIRILKENTPHFESVDCQPAYFHTLTSVACTHHAIDSIVIKTPEVNYDPTTEHLYLYLDINR